MRWECNKFFLGGNVLWYVYNNKISLFQRKKKEYLIMHQKYIFILIIYHNNNQQSDSFVRLSFIYMKKCKC